MSNKYLNKIIKSKEKLRGELGKEQEAYEEFISGGWKTESEDNSGKIISFFPEKLTADNITNSGNSVTKLAADSDDTNRHKSETYFYVSEDDKFALKVDEKTEADESSLTATVISERVTELNDCILYCPETNKHFLLNQTNEIILTGYKNFDYQKFTFKLIYPKAKIFFIMGKDSERYTILSTDQSFTVNKYDIKDGSIEIELDNAENIKNITLKSDNCLDFISLQKNKTLVPIILAGSKFELLIY